MRERDTCTVSVGLLCLNTRSQTSIVPDMELVKNTAGLVGLQQPSVSGDKLYLLDNTHTYAWP